VRYNIVTYERALRPACRTAAASEPTGWLVGCRRATGCERRLGAPHGGIMDTSAIDTVWTVVQTALPWMRVALAQRSYQR
jgi:hypothetical protein